MKLTKRQLKRIIKEELENVVETVQLEGGPEVDIKDAIDMLKAEEARQESWNPDYQTGQIAQVYWRLEEALKKLGFGDEDPLADYGPPRDDEPEIA